jgi:hypothetical protein
MKWVAGGIAVSALMLAAAVEAKTLDFAGHRWTVRPNGVGGPRNNRWCQANAFVDAQGRLHLRLTKTTRGWCSAEVSSTDRMGFGDYRWTLDSRVDRFDKNVVLGLFNYPTSDVGGDGTNEIDIEFAHWGKARWDPLNYTVFPRDPKVRSTTTAFPLTLAGERSTHSFDWTASAIRFRSFEAEGVGAPLRDWTFKPPQPARAIPQAPMPVYMNLWVVAPPANGQPVEVIVRDFTFTPAGRR